MLSDYLGHSRLLRGGWNRIKGLLPDTGNLPHSLLWTSREGVAYRGSRDPHLRDRRVVFSANPGRAGSGLLARILLDLPGFHGGHEPRPRMTGPILDDTLVRALAESRDARTLKLRCVDRRLSEHGPESIYVETSNMFIKTFHDVIAADFSEPRVVILRRDPVELLQSFQDLAWFDPRNPSWRRWLCDPVGPNRVVQPLWEAEGRPGPEVLGKVDPVERGIAYLVDFEGRVTRHLGPSSPFTTISTTAERLATEEGRLELLEWLGVRESREPRIIPDRTNVRSGWKVFYGSEARLSKAELGDRVADYIHRALAAGVDLPEIPRSW